MEIPGFTGTVLHPTDEGYDEARAIWNGAIDRRPAVIARCTSTADVSAAIRWAGTRGLRASVLAGGHGVAGLALLDDGLLLDLSPMKAVEVDPAARRVRVQPGVLLGELDQATQAHGLVVPAGIVSHTGVAGLTLGGGIGSLMRAYGLTCDNLVAAEMVRADGAVVRISDEENPDLLWAVRGGGGGYGVVTSFEFRAHPLGPTVLAGPLVFPAEDAREVLQGYAGFIDDAPDEITTVLNLRWAPPAPWIPPEIHGREIVLVSSVYAGDPRDGEAAVKPLRNLGRPLLDLVRPMPFVEHQSMYDGPVPHGQNYYWKSPYLRVLDAHAIEVLTAAWEASSHTSYIIMFQLGGAAGRSDPTASAFEDRTAVLAPNINAVWADPHEPNPDVEWARDVYRRFEPSTTGKAYVNFQSEIDRGDSFGDAKAERLAGIKRTWDPDGFFHSA